MARPKKIQLPQYDHIVDSSIAIYYAIWWTAPEWVYRFQLAGMKLENGKTGTDINVDDYSYYRNRFKEVPNVHPYTKTIFDEFITKLTTKNVQKNKFF